jgi:spermidine synthase
VVERINGGHRERLMLHGATVHGLEIDDGPALGYHGPGSGVGLALAALRARGPLHIGVVGLGPGTMAAHARAGDTLRFYEINPAVTAMARAHFHYLKGHPVIPGDARLALAAEAPRRYDLLVMDAFQGGTVPVHLLTLEAFREYRRHLKSRSVLAVNISNRRLHLAPIVNGAARELGWATRVIEHQAEAPGERDSRWILLTSAGEVANALAAQPVTVTAPPPWTDDHASLFRVWR